MYGLIGGISVLIMIIAVICNDNTDSLISDIVKNLAIWVRGIYNCCAAN